MKNAINRIKTARNYNCNCNCNCNCDCSCSTCDYIRKHGSRVPNGVAGAIIVPYEYIYSDNLLYRGRLDEYVILLGKEQALDSRYFEEFNLPGGKLERKDNGCYIDGFKRELFEEFKIDVRNGNSFDRHFRENPFRENPFGGTSNKGKIRVIFFNETPVFVGIFPGLSRGPLNDLIRKDNNNHHLDICHREMSEVDYFRIQTPNYERMDGQVVVLSSYATGVMDEIKRSGILNNILD